MREIARMLWLSGSFPGALDPTRVGAASSSWPPRGPETQEQTSAIAVARSTRMGVHRVVGNIEPRVDGKHDGIQREGLQGGL
eukprot:987198-Rhodomonas_salina.2